MTFEKPSDHSYYQVTGASRNWAILSRIITNELRKIATSANWNVTHLA